MNALQLSGLYPILSEGVVALADFAETAAALAPHVNVMQLRLKTVADRDAVALHRQVADRLADWPGRLVINDRADLAHLLARHVAGRLRIGLHLGQTDLPPHVARTIVGPDVAIGLSTHNIAQLRAALAEPIDHVALGPIFATQSKANPDPIVGLEILAEAANLAAARACPLVAIGGINAANVDSVYRAGATSVAVIAGIFDEGHVDLDRLAFFNPREAARE